MMTPEMQSEFDSIVLRRKADGDGTIGARTYALGCMVATRRNELCAILRVFPRYSDAGNGDLTALLRVNAELTLLMIERGA